MSKQTRRNRRNKKNRWSRWLRSLKKATHAPHKDTYFESLEQRVLFSLVGVTPDFPVFTYDNTGTVSYDAATDTFDLDADPIFFRNSAADPPIFVTGAGDFKISIQVDSSGNLIGGTPGDDLILTGDVDVDGDTVIDFSGVLLTGEVNAFGFLDSGGPTDDYDFQFSVTGGLMAGFYAGGDIGVVTSSENSNFTGNFNVDFTGEAKGTLGLVVPPPTAMLGDFVWEDLDADGIQDAGEPGIAGVEVKLLADLDDDGQIDDIVDTILTSDGTTDYDNDGVLDIVGFYKFNGLTPGVEYQVMFNNPDPDGPDAYMFSPQDQGGDDTVDSDADPVDGMSQVVVLAPGEFNPTIDAGLFRKGSIHVFGFLDEDGDGVLDDNEGAFPADPGKTIELLDENGNVIDVMVTNVDGEVWFEGLVPGTYTVRENPVPDGYMLTTAPTVTVTIQSGEEHAYAEGRAMLPDGDGRTEVIDERLVFGNTQLAMLGDFVWEDLDADGIQDAGEPGIAGVEVKLLADLDDDGQIDDIVDTILTSDGTTDYDNDGVLDIVGFYKFNGLTPGVEYQVMFNNPDPDGPDAYMFSPQDQGGDDTVDSDADPVDGMSQVVVLAPGEFNPTIDAGLFRKGSIHVFGFLDEDGDGVLDDNEGAFPADPGKTIELLDENGNVIDVMVTNVDGEVWFEGLVPGTYTVRENPVPDGYMLTTAPTVTVTIQSGEEHAYAEGRAMLPDGDGRTEVIDERLVFGNTQLAMLGDFVWEDLDADGIQDAGEPGIAGVEVKLLADLDDDGQIDDIVDTILTSDGTTDYDNDGVLDIVGFYKFNGLTPGVEYQVMFNNPDPDGPDAYMFSPQDQGGDDTVDSDADPVDGMSQVVVLAPGEFNPTIDAGLFRKGSIHVFGFLDEDGDGVLDDNEGAFPADPGKTIELLDENGNVIDVMVTNVDGEVWFEGLVPGTYTVRENPVPDGYMLTTAPTVTVTIQSGEEHAYAEGRAMLPDGDGRTEVIDERLVFGNTQLAMLGDFVWEDLDADGIQDDGEPGIEGVEVLLKKDGVLTGDSTFTDANGNYLFDGLMPGTYSVQFVAPDGFIASPENQGGDDAVDSDGVLAMNLMTAETTLESGEEDLTLDQGFYRPARLGDFVWEDLDADGIQDDGEPGIEGVEVLLKKDGVLTGDSTFTDANGNYLFDGLMPGTYSVQFVAPDGFIASPENQGGDDAVDSDGVLAMNLMTAETTLESGEEDLTLDQGFYRPARLGDFVWEDLDADGIQDDGEPGIEGVEVLLKKDGVLTGDSTFTDANGNYLFDGLMPGTYSVQFVAPDGFIASPENQGGDDAVDSDGVLAMNLMTAETTLESGEEDLTLDQGFYRPARLGDFVWEDLDADGIQDDGEPGIEGVEVLLKKDGVLTGDSTFTDANGNYLFDGLMPGTYSVQFVAPDGFIASPENQGGDDAVDSDGVLAMNLMTAETTLESGEEDLTLDQGFYQPDRSIDLEKLTNGVDADTEAEAVLVNPGDPITWTYVVTNTGAAGDGTFTLDEIEIVDDNGTPSDPSDDFSTTSGDIVFDASSDDNSDGILSVGEQWLYTAMGVAQDLGGGATGPVLSVNMSGNSALDGPAGNTRRFSVDGIDIDARAFSREKSSGDWYDAWLGAYSGGLGVTDTSGGDSHTVDNIGIDDNYVLFEFSETVVVDAAFLGFVIDDSDISVWIGNVDSPIASLSDALLNGLEFTEVNNTVSSSPRLADINGDEVAGNVLIIAASTADTTPEDKFKIETLKFQRVESGGCYVNHADLLVNGELEDEDLSHYCNGDPEPGIDIEKLTNGVDADTEADAPEIAPGDLVTWTYKVTNTGNVAFTMDQIEIVDDAGTPGDTSDDFSTTSGDITLDASSDTGVIGVLEVGEMWIYEASDVAQDLGDGGAVGPVSTISLTGNSGLDGTNGNIRTFSADGISVHASAFSRDSGGTWQTAFLGAFSNGLGVTDSSEGDGSNGLHRIDNVGRHNYVLLEFSETVVVDRAFLDSVVNDSDISVWIGTVDNAFNNHITLSDAVLNGLGFTEVNNGGSSARWADINANEVAGNVLVIAASTADTTPEDRFKLRKVDVQRVDPGGCYENMAVVTAGGVSDSDLSHYCNPDDQPELGKIGDRVWNDKDMDGIQDADEEGIEGVKVQLRVYDETQSKYVFYTVAYTDTDGKYCFEDLEAGDYKVKFFASDEYTFSPKNVNNNANDTVDSDVVAVSATNVGRTANIVLGQGEINNTIDAGLYKEAAPEVGKICGTVYYDDSGAYGVFDAYDEASPNCPVYLQQYINGQWVNIAYTVTDYNGNYCFENLAPGQYRIDIPTPSGYDYTYNNVDHEVGGDGYAVVWVGAGECVDVDAGFLYSYYW